MNRPGKKMFSEDEKLDEKKEEELTQNVNDPIDDAEASTDNNDNNQDSENTADTIEDLSKKYDKTYDALLRAQAEIENIKKRTTKEVENAHKYSIESILQEIIPIYESLSFSLSFDQNNVDTGKVLEGNKLSLD